ncbi:MAG: hypothetical protein U0704_07605 [Candidatus Eisenbacteria bacterium]
MKPKGIVGLSVLLFSIGLGTTSARGLTTISPAQPTATDTVTVTVHAGFPAMCWDVGPASWVRVQPDTLMILVSVDYCGGYPGCSCAQFPDFFTRTCKVAPLPVGTYIAKSVELHVNPADPLPTVTTFLQFTVTESTPTLRRSWGALKSFYR